MTACASEDPDAGTNGVGKLSAAKIETKSRKAAEQADAVRLSGDVISQGRTYSLEMRLKRDDGGTGKVSSKGGSTFELLRTGKDLYLKADTDFWAKQEKGGGEPSESDVDAARKLQNKYVKVPHGDPAYQQFSGFTDMSVMLDGLLTLNGKRATGERGTVRGTKTIRVVAGKGGGGIVDVSLMGTPYPLRVERGGQAGVLQLEDWNKDFDLEPPEKNEIVDYGKSISAD
nr:hypothetical protein [Streptomyces sp. HNM0574]